MAEMVTWDLLPEAFRLTLKESGPVASGLLPSKSRTTCSICLGNRSVLRADGGLRQCLCVVILG